MCSAVSNVIKDNITRRAAISVPTISFIKRSLCFGRLNDVLSAELLTAALAVVFLLRRIASIQKCQAPRNSKLQRQQQPCPVDRKDKTRRRYPELSLFRRRFHRRTKIFVLNHCDLAAVCPYDFGWQLPLPVRRRTDPDLSERNLVPLPKNQSTANARRILPWHFPCAYRRAGNSGDLMSKNIGHCRRLADHWSYHRKPSGCRCFTEITGKTLMIGAPESSR